MPPPLPSLSYKDPDGFVISINGVIYRLINQSYKNNYNTFITSGLYKELSETKMLLKHEEIDPTEINLQTNKKVFKVLKPELIPFISYPYEWSFTQLKNAALLTLNIQLKALEKNMWLKDANCYNVQFNGADAIFIDTSSFENYEENAPWPAYGQFCRHFLGPLLLHAYGKKELCSLSMSYPDGIPLQVISYSLPQKTKFSFFILSHIHYHAKLEKRYNHDESFKKKKLQISKSRVTALVHHLKNGIENLQFNNRHSEWSHYYKTFSYSKENFIQKQNVIVSFIESIKPSTLLDLGCNEGEFSILCSKKVNHIVAVDSDAVVINNLALKLTQMKITNVLPLVVNIAHPSPGIGILNNELSSFTSRANFDVILALALVHHLAIGNNIPFELMAKQFAQLSSQLIIEFVPKEDPQAQKLLITKKDVFIDYNIENFISSFNLFYFIKEQQQLNNSGRILFLMQAHA